MAKGGTATRGMPVVPRTSRLVIIRSRRSVWPAGLIRSTIPRGNDLNHATCWATKSRTPQGRYWFYPTRHGRGPSSRCTHRGLNSQPPVYQRVPSHCTDCSLFETLTAVIKHCPSFIAFLLLYNTETKPFIKIRTKVK